MTSIFKVVKSMEYLSFSLGLLHAKNKIITKKIPMYLLKYILIFILLYISFIFTCCFFQ
ncbi:Uncharacterised protein [Myroides odoratimimus]|uniref:Uncharacterized protein n=1 Tax=Myroides odoratimimus CCUG 10230 TaxID=883150 RepID=A0ABN0EDR4_9FLAO|nr:hypothetical protein HMPREF9712_00197 [Myroides odoratimimus CCUG 10230]STZ47706.1 Uncharacterised protein [Myroides odoratimimus]